MKFNIKRRTLSSNFFRPLSTATATSTDLSMSAVCRTSSESRTEQRTTCGRYRPESPESGPQHGQRHVCVVTLSRVGECVGGVAAAHFREGSPCCLRLAAGSVTSPWAEAPPREVLVWRRCCKALHCHPSGRIGTAAKSLHFSWQLFHRYIFLKHFVHFVIFNSIKVHFIYKALFFFKKCSNSIFLCTHCFLLAPAFSYPYSS